MYVSCQCTDYAAIESSRKLVVRSLVVKRQCPVRKGAVCEVKDTMPSDRDEAALVEVFKVWLKEFCLKALYVRFHTLGDIWCRVLCKNVAKIKTDLNSSSRLDDFVLPTPSKIFSLTVW